MNENTTKLLFSISEAMAATSLGRTKIYELIGNGALETVTLVVPIIRLSPPK